MPPKNPIPSFVMPRIAVGAPEEEDTQTDINKPPEFEWSREVIIQLIAVGVQFMSGLVIAIMVLAGVWNDVEYPLTGTIPVWYEDGTATLGDTATFRDNVITLQEITISGGVPIAWIIVGFFWVSAAFEGLAAYLVGVKNTSEEEEEEYRPTLYHAESIYTLRFLEYSITASAMLVAIAAQVGIWDWRTLSCIGALSATCMLCGIIGEREANQNKKNAALSFMVGTIAFAFAWLPILWTFFRARTSATPPIVTGIVVSELVLWILFALVQFVQIIFSLRTETVLPYYLVLSVLSKGLLGWLTVSQVLANK